jgi:hypothetical protein
MIVIHHHILDIPSLLLYGMVTLSSAWILVSKVYLFPEKAGLYEVGFKSLTLGSKHISIFYPCLRQTSKINNFWLLDLNYYEKMYETSMKDKEKPGKMPKLFYWFSTHYFRKIKMGTY